MSSPINPQLIVIIVSALVAVLLIGVVVLPMIKRGVRQAGVRANGKDAIATIRAVERTGMGVDEQAEIKLVVWVEPREIPAYEAALVTTVLASELATTYRVGAQLHVRYDPADPSKLALIGPYAK